MKCCKADESLYGVDAVQTIESACQDSIHAMSYSDQQGIFDVMYQDAEVQDDMNDIRVGRPATRRASMNVTSSKHKTNSVNDCRYRRHSSFNPRNRQAHRDAHSHLEEYFLERGNPQRSSIVSTLLDFHSSFELSMVGAAHDVSSALHFSCPVLSYMHDSDEDSVEMNITKRPSLMLGTNGSENIEYLNYDSDNNGDNLVDSFQLPEEKEYVIEMSEEEQYTNSHRETRRKRPSYITLERRLSTESHLAVLKSMITGEKEDSNLDSEDDVTNCEPTPFLETRTSRTVHGSTEQGGASQLSTARMA
jgi:hypothetical protein